MSRQSVNLLTFAVLSLWSAGARAGRPYVVVRDDGTIQSTKVKTAADVGVITDAVLTGYLAFLDPPKESSAPALKARIRTRR